jgi:hypothetical protein
VFIAMQIGQSKQVTHLVGNRAQQIHPALLPLVPR